VKKSQIAKAVDRVERLPAFARNRALNIMIGRAVPFVGTSGLRITKATNNEWIATLDNRRKVGNHLKQIHACAMILIGETIGVMIMAMNLPGDRIPLVKNIEADFVKRSSGKMTGVVKLTDEQIALIHNEPKGELELEVVVTDESGESPVLLRITTAWVPKNRDAIENKPAATAGGNHS